jgi:hypothetical protein
VRRGLFIQPIFLSILASVSKEDSMFGTFIGYLKSVAPPASNLKG